MLFVSLLAMSAGYALLYAGIKGNKAKLNGTPLWQAPWAPFVAAISGGTGFSGLFGGGSSSSGGGSSGNFDTGRTNPNSPSAQIQNGINNLKRGIAKGFGLFS